MWVTNQCCSPGLSEPHINVSCIVMNQSCFSGSCMFFPPLLQTPGANTCSRLLQAVLSMQLLTAHTKIKGCNDTDIVSELWGQTLESSILLVIRSQKVPKRTFNIVAYHLAHCNPLAVTHGRASVLLHWVSPNNPLYFKKGRTSSNQCNEPLQVTEGKKLMT